MGNDTRLGAVSQGCGICLSALAQTVRDHVAPRAATCAAELRTNPLPVDTLRALHREHALTEVAFSGMYQLGSWETRRHAPKAELRAALAEFLHLVLPIGSNTAFMQPRF